MKTSNHALALLLLVTVAAAAAHDMVMAADCSNTVSDLAPCLPVVTGSGGAPDGACCGALTIVGHTCLCQYISSGSPPAGFNPSAAEALLGVCGIPGPSSCT
ncbi:hypothetical protein O6H91_01G086000 [Diphasiastrum complanatum]|uniref:Uncharacterized protein n=1 Tax=Diphasiastrum complanatum TaxID=34168 RepID=A0ACC2ET17_DIPCM|nr:hypothetical protein O6H91_01G086000 [Diphasiastrum complanatum]